MVQCAFGNIPGIVRAHTTQRVPVALTPQEVGRVRDAPGIIRVQLQA